MKFVHKLGALTVLFMTVFILRVPDAIAYKKPDREVTPDLDQRKADRQKAKPLAPEKEAAARLRTRVPGLRIELDETLQTPRLISAPGGFLSGPKGVGKTISDAAARTYAEADLHRPIKAFLDDHAALFGHGAEVLPGAKLKNESVAPHNGLRTVVWQQQAAGIPVFEGVLIGHITRQGELVSLSSYFLPNPEQAARAAVPIISAEEAVRLAAENMGEELAAEEIFWLEEPNGSEKRQAFQAGFLPGAGQARLVWLPMDRATLRLCWQIELTRLLGGERFRLLVDAQNGDVLLRRCLTVYLADATYRVYTGESPSPLSPTYPTPTTNQPPMISRSLVTLSAVNTTASPLGWINERANETRGNNVDAHLDRNADDLPDLPRPHGSPFRVFDFPMDAAQSPTTYSEAAVVQLFYWCNWMHDQLYELGFTEAGGNFQKDNLGRGGQGNDAVQADAQDGSGFNNANFTPTADGEAPRIQMYLFNGPNPDRDGDFDAQIILHEYTHGLSDRTVGGGVGISALQTAGMGEGWSDFYALALLSQPGQDPDGAYAMGGYASFQFFGLGENYYYGIRRYPYTTDLSKNPLTFKDIDPAQIDPHADVPVNPLDPFNPFFANEVHSQGEVWCVTLWDARANLIRKHGFAQGNRLILQLVTDGMRLTPPNPNFLEARDAILQADIVSNGGANRNELWAAFAKRGMGFSATSPFSTATAGLHEAYDLPDALVLSASSGFISSGPQGGPFSPACKVYGLTNNSSSALNWSVAVTDPWLKATPASGSLAPGAGVAVSVCLDTQVNSLPLGNYLGGITFSNAASGVVQTRAAHLRVMSFTSMPFAEDFESGALAPYWMVTGTGGSHVAVTSNDGPHAGKYHLLMDAQNNSSGYARNEVTLGIDLAGYSNVVLRFWVKTLGDEPDGPPPVPFIDGANFDGLAISQDGVAWYEVQSFRFLPEASAPLNIDLDAAVARFGLSYNSTFRIRFNQYDNFAAPFDGIAIDDIVIAGIPARRLTLTVPPNATEGDGTLTNLGIVRLAVPRNIDLTVNLASSDSSKVRVPASVTIPAGATNATFSLGIPDNAILDGTQIITISASVPGYYSLDAIITVYDNEVTKLKVKLPPHANEGDGLLKKAGTVELKQKPARDVRVSLTSSDPDLVQVPSTVTVPAGSDSASFELRIGDEHKLDGPQHVKVTAHVEGWPDGSDTILVRENDSPQLFLTLPALISEGNGLLNRAGVLRLSGTLATNLIVKLTSSDLTELAVPPTVFVPAGFEAVSFNIEAVDDALLDGVQTVTVRATAPRFRSAAASIKILDDEMPPIPYQPFPPHLSTENALDSYLLWKSGAGEAMLNGGFETGDFTGWVKEDLDYGTFSINDGRLDPDGPDGTITPHSGRFDAMTQQIGGGMHLLYQDVIIPVDTKSATLTWFDLIRNHADHYSHPNHEFRVEIRDLNNNVLALAFTTRPGDPLTNNWVQRGFDLISFRGKTVRIAFVEEDRLGYFNVHVDDVSVKLGDIGELSFDVYFGTRAIPGAAEFSGNTTNVFWPLPPLALNTTYYWQVVSRQGAAKSPGPIWQFRTRGIGEVDHFEWSVIGDQIVHQPFTVTLTAKDDINNTVPTFAGPVTLTGLRGNGNASAVLITEVDPRADDQVEFSNVSGRPIDISGWQISIYDSKSWPAPLTTFTVAPGTMCQPSDVFQLKKSGTYPGSYPIFFAGTNFFWNNSAVTNPVAVLLQDAAGQVIDFFCAVDANPAAITQPISIPQDEWLGNPAPPNTNTIRTFQRFGSSDHNSSADWTIGVSNLGTLNVDLTLPFEPRNPVSLSPAFVTTFTNGVWQGKMIVAETVSNLALLATGDPGRFGFANAFKVEATNDLALVGSGSPALVIAGDELTYTFTVYNDRTSAVSGVALVDLLPPDVTYISSASSQGSCIPQNGIVSCSLGTMAAGSSATVTIVVIPNKTGTMTNIANLSPAPAETYLANNTAAIVSTVNFPVMSVHATTVTEGNSGTTNALFPIRLSAPCKLPVSAHFATANSSAIAGVDYVPVSGTVIFPPGTTNQTVPVPVIGDRLDENQETIFLILSFPTNATIAVALARGRIVDDDSSPVVSIGDVTVREAAPGTITNAVFTVRLTVPSELPIAVNYVTSGATATSDSDFIAQSGTVTFAAGETNQTISIVVYGDTIYETNETFFVTLSTAISAGLGRSQGVGTILDNGVVELDHFSWSRVPSPQYATAPFAVMLTAQDARNVTVSNFTGHVALQALARSADIQVGNASSAAPNPIGTLYEDSRSQIIYLAQELAGPGRFTALSLFVTKVPGQTMSNWTIRLKHTPLASYVKPSWEGSGWTTVYQHDERISLTGWVTFFFDTPFDYNGTNNLLVDFSFNNASYTGDGQCRYTVSKQPRLLYFRTDSGFGDPLAWSGTNAPLPILSNQVPNVRFIVENAIPISPVLSGDFLNGVWLGQLTLGESATNTFLRATSAGGQTGFSNFFAVDSGADTDGDGLPDAWELRHFGSLNAINGGPNEDADGDGATNLEEFRTGTNPLNASSVNRISAIQVQGRDIVIRFSTEVAKSYRVERAENPGASEWLPVGTPVAGNGQVMQVADPGAVSQAGCFYRVRLLP